MLRVTRLSASAGAYYLADLATELGVEPLSGRSPPWPAAREPARDASRWWGEAAARLGLTGPVGGVELEAVLAGRHPRTGRAMTARHGAIAGYDLTFAAPKSASVLFALGGPDVAAEVLGAHHRAVESALGYVTRRALSARRTDEGERRVVAVDGPIAATFAHGVSRSLDPHLHTHVVVANLGHGPDGRWTALDGRGLFAHAAAAGHAYDAELRCGLTERLGAGWTLRRNGAYELADVDPLLLGTLSGRAAEIRQRLGTGPAPSSRARVVAWAATRPAKTHDPTPADLRRRWRSLAEDAGLGPPELHGLGRHRGPATVTGRGSVDPAAVDEHRFAAALMRTPHATATRRDVMAAWAGAVAGGSHTTEIDRCVDALASWGDEVGVAERHRPLAALVPAAHLLRALGPRPASSGALDVWLAAAASVDRYRKEWSIARSGPSGHPLGLSGEPGELSRLPARRLADHLATERALADVRRRLGREPVREAEALERSLGLG